MSQLADVSRDGRSALLSRTVARGDSNIYLLDLEHSSETLLTPHEGQATFPFAKFGTDGAEWLVADDGGERLALASIAIATRLVGALEYVVSRDDADVDHLELNDAGTTALIAWNLAGKSELEHVDITTRRRTPGPRLPHEICIDVGWSPDGKRIIVVTTGSAAPLDIWVGDPGAEVTQVTHSPHPGVDLAALARPRLEHFTAHDGLGLSGWLYVPQEFNAPGPCVLSFHGGPEAQGASIGNPRASRVDLYADVGGWAIVHADRAGLITHADLRVHFRAGTDEVETVQAGKSPFLVRLYRKDIEVRQRGGFAPVFWGDGAVR